MVPGSHLAGLTTSRALEACKSPVLKPTADARHLAVRKAGHWYDRHADSDDDDVGRVGLAATIG
jgi:hypothetical protein